MTSTTKIDRHQQLRRVAILVATLDEPLAERLLTDLPPREAAAVRKIVARSEEIDPEERRAVVADFRRGFDVPQRPQNGRPQHEQPRTQLDGVELDASLLALMEDDESFASMPSWAANTSPWQALSDSDAATLVEMLSAEQPQTIAVVMSRLETSRAAELITKLPSTLQTDVLMRLADLDPADEQTLEVVESQLATWISAQRQRRQRMAAGRDLVKRILQDTPERQRTVLLAQLGRRSPALAEKLAIEPGLSQRVVQHTASPSPDYHSRKKMSTPPMDPQTKVASLSTEPLSELESLDDESLLKALRLADRQTVMIALAGANEGLMKRIVRGLPRRRANQFRQQVRSIGPTRLADMLAAQRELIRHANA